MLSSQAGVAGSVPDLETFAAARRHVVAPSEQWLKERPDLYQQVVAAAPRQKNRLSILVIAEWLRQRYGDDGWIWSPQSLNKIVRQYEQSHG